MTLTLPLPMMLPLRAMQVMVAPLPRLITVPTGMETGLPGGVTHGQPSATV